MPGSCFNSSRRAEVFGLKTQIKLESDEKRLVEKPDTTKGQKDTQSMKLSKLIVVLNYLENKLKEDLVKIVKRDIEEPRAAETGLDIWRATIIEIL